MKKKTILDQIEITRNGVIQIRFGLLILDDDGSEISCRWHRTSIEPGGDVAATIAAVNADITTRPTLKAVAIDTMPLVQAIVSLVHTPEVIAAHKAGKTSSAQGG